MAHSRALKRLVRLEAILGHICVEWARLEYGLNSFIEILTPLEEGDISRSITANMDLRAKIQTIKALAYLRKPSDEWFEKMVLLLDYIDNNLRPRRNRYIHDGWYIPEGKLIKRMHHVKFDRPQAFQYRLRTETITPVKLREVKQLAAELDDLIITRFVFWCDYAYPHDLRPLPTKLFRQFVRRARPDTPLTYVNSVRQHPREA